MITHELLVCVDDTFTGTIRGTRLLKTWPKLQRQNFLLSKNKPGIQRS